ncbi:TPA: DUF2829 domain-containing protein [Escherichia coli]|uniref:DUF2829 domain-containing protein n=1 Tax=Escherichia sp. KTE52 TaxID=1182659 RepID=UPI00033BE7B6|nr:DUF2829 domain-containing protein [Escherichia sp. KTE52]EOV48550.1 hypothetical protein A1SC_01975 [Escherichia sp. KTE52]
MVSTFQVFPKYKCHSIIRASKIKDIVIVGEAYAPIFGSIEVVEPKGMTLRVDGVFLEKFRPQIGGYLVTAENGYLVYVPEKAFEKCYSRVNDASENGVSLSIEGHNGVTFITARDVTIAAGGIITTQEEIDLEAADFSDALMWLKEGKKVARREWKGEKQFCWLVLAGSVNLHGIHVPYGDHFVLKDAQNMDSVWLPSVDDLLACDWFVVE